MDRYEDPPRSYEPSRRPAATRARMQSPGTPVPSRVQGARSGNPPSLHQAQRVLAVPSQALALSPATLRSRFTLAEIEMRQLYGRTRTLSPTLDRNRLEKFHPVETARLSRALDVMDMVLRAAGDFSKELQSDARRNAAKRRIGRLGGDRR